MHSAAAAFLLNIDFGATNSAKVGFAATGLTANDFWNGASSKLQQLAFFPNLLTSDGSPTTVTMVLANAPGHWSAFVSDPMYNFYDYNNSIGNPCQGGLVNVPAGIYNLFLYGYQSFYTVQVGTNSYGPLGTLDNPPSNPPPWQEGRHYVVFSNLVVRAGQVIQITIGPGAQGWAVIAGLQLQAVDLSLTFGHSGQSELITWPAWAQNFVLQQADAIVGPGLVWEDVPATPTNTNGVWSVLLPTDAPQRFYRLRAP